MSFSPSILVQTFGLAASLAMVACTTQVGGETSGPDARTQVQNPDADTTPPVDAPPPFEGPCEEGDAQREHEGTCYEFFSASKSWSAAREHCMQLGGDLARIDNQLLLSVLALLVPSVQPEAWIRGTDQASEGSWTWGGEPMDFEQWASGQPDNGAGQAPENCLIMISTLGGNWDDRPCSNDFNYVCERTNHL